MAIGRTNASGGASGGIMYATGQVTPVNAVGVVTGLGFKPFAIAGEYAPNNVQWGVIGVDNDGNFMSSGGTFNELTAIYEDGFSFKTIGVNDYTITYYAWGLKTNV